MFHLTNFEDKFVPPNLSNIFFECTYLNPVILKEYYSKLKHDFENLKDITQLQANSRIWKLSRTPSLPLQYACCTSFLY